MKYIVSAAFLGVAAAQVNPLTASFGAAESSAVASMVSSFANGLATNPAVLSLAAASPSLLQQLQGLQTVYPSNSAAASSLYAAAAALPSDVGGPLSSFIDAEIATLSAIANSGAAVATSGGSSAASAASSAVASASAAVSSALGSASAAASSAASSASSSAMAAPTNAAKVAGAALGLFGAAIAML